MQPDFLGPGKEPTRVSRYLPGSRERIEELTRRASAGEELFGEKDWKNERQLALNWQSMPVLMAKLEFDIRYIYKQGSKWRCRPWIGVAGQKVRIDLGSFDTEEAAVTAFVAWRAKREQAREEF